MSYFEVYERDGPGRTGELRINGDSAETPLVAEHTREGVRLGGILLEESGTAYHPSEGDFAPDYPSPLKADDRLLRLLESKSTSFGKGDRYLAAAVHGGENRGLRRSAASDLDGCRVLTLGSAPGINGSPRKFVDAVSATRTAARPDTAIYAPGAARPWSVPLLIYAGIDVLDDAPARIAAARGTYFEPDRAIPLEDVGRTPCSCPSCSGGPPEEDELLDHNRAVLRAEVDRAASSIERGRLRELVEQRTRAKPWTVETLRHLDARRDYLERRTPVFRASRMLACGEESLRRPGVKRFASRVRERYVPPDANVVAILPCSAGKPYSTSRSHREFLSATKGRAHEVILTSPLGAVPRELEMVYPAAHYDIPVTGDWSEEEVSWMAENLESLLAKGGFDKAVAHVRGGYREAVERVEDSVGETEFVYTSLEGHPTGEESLSRLREELAGEDAPYDRLEEVVRSMTDYMLGLGASDRLDGYVTGRYPRVKMRRGDEVLATAVPRYGALAFTLAARDVFPEGYTVEIDDFVPEGSVLAPGVLEAPSGVRAGDEVLVEGPAAVCVGRAEMSGPEMERSERGVAVDVRHREER